MRACIRCGKKHFEKNFPDRKNKWWVCLPCKRIIQNAHRKKNIERYRELQRKVHNRRYWEVPGVREREMLHSLTWYRKNWGYAIDYAKAKLWIKKTFR